LTLGQNKSGKITNLITNNGQIPMNKKIQITNHKLQTSSPQESVTLRSLRTKSQITNNKKITITIYSATGG